MRSPRRRRKFTYCICHFKRVEINSKNLKIKIKRRIHFLIAIAKAPYIHESDSSSLVLLQTDKLEKLFTLQNVANLQGIGFTPEKYVALLDDR